MSGKDGIELRFDAEKKLEKAEINALKSIGFRWSKNQKLWYAFYEPTRAKLLVEIFKSGQVKDSLKTKDKVLWEMKNSQTKAGPVTTKKAPSKSETKTTTKKTEPKKNSKAKTVTTREDVLKSMAAAVQALAAGIEALNAL